MGIPQSLLNNDVAFGEQNNLLDFRQSVKQGHKYYIFIEVIIKLFIDKSEFHSRVTETYNLKKEIHVIIQSKHFSLLDFSLRI